MLVAAREAKHAEPAHHFSRETATKRDKHYRRIGRQGVEHANELVGLANAHAGTNAASVVLAEQVAERREVLDDGRRVGDLTEAVDNLAVTVTIGLSHALGHSLAQSLAPRGITSTL